MRVLVSAAPCLVLALLLVALTHAGALKTRGTKRFGAAATPSLEQDGATLRDGRWGGGRDRNPSIGIGVGDHDRDDDEDDDDDDDDRPVMGETCVCPREDGVVCNGHGTCNVANCMEMGQMIAVCACDDGWVGRKCEYDSARIGDAVKDRQDQMQGLINATQHMFDRYRGERMKCTNPDAPIACPNREDKDKDDDDHENDNHHDYDDHDRRSLDDDHTDVKCVANVLQCFNSSRNGREEYEHSERDRCRGENKGFCLLGGCVPEDSRLLCPPISTECPADKPVRCWTWRCAENETMCPPPRNKTRSEYDRDSDHDDGDGDDDEYVLCPDGSAAQSMRDCARNMTWNGCAAGKVECPQRRGKCEDSLAECGKRTGCLGRNVSCGFLRDPLTGSVLLESVPGSSDLRMKSYCREECQHAEGYHTATPVPTVGLLADEIGGSRKLEVYGEDGRVALRIKVGAKDAYKRLDDLHDSPVSFSVRPVPDSHKQEGSFKEFEKAGTLRAIVTIEPTSPIELNTQNGGLELNFPVLDDAGWDSDQDGCSRLVSGMQVLSVDDISDLDASPEFVQSCSPVLLDEAGGRGRCSCAVNVTHFTTFAAVDAQAHASMTAASMTLDELGEHMKVTWNSSYFYDTYYYGPACYNETRSFVDLRNDDSFATGGLGKNMWLDHVEVWGCFPDHPCLMYIEAALQDEYGVSWGEWHDSADERDSMCYIYHEKEKNWLPWAPSSLLMLYKIEDDTSPPPGAQMPPNEGFAAPSCGQGEEQYMKTCLDKLGEPPTCLEDGLQDGMPCLAACTYLTALHKCVPNACCDDDGSRFNTELAVMIADAPIDASKCKPFVCGDPLLVY